MMSRFLSTHLYFHLHIIIAKPINSNKEKGEYYYE